MFLKKQRFWKRVYIYLINIHHLTTKTKINFLMGIASNA